MSMHGFGLDGISTIRPGVRSRSACAENPEGNKGGGAQAGVGDDKHCTKAAERLGKGWKVRPCYRDFEPGQTLTLLDAQGPGEVRHIWITVLDSVQRRVSFEVFYDDATEPSIRVPLGDFFANGLDGCAVIGSAPITVAPKGGMNSYWPMPFRKRIRIEVRNDGREKIDYFFYQIDYTLGDVPDDAGYLHAEFRRGMTTREHPEHTLLDGVEGAGQYVGTYIVWNQLSNGWWGEGEVKFFIDDDPSDAPTICGTGTEDYFGGAWGFVQNHATDMRPMTYSTPYLGYPQAVYDATDKAGPRLPSHALYRWHIPDPVHFEKNLRVTVQALGWWPDQTYQPLTDDLASTAYFYLREPRGVASLPPVEERFAR
ncbi:MAG: DUF2961 domain-containing protein [Phycisphaeraceae bacterium]|nr:MAG: DUF2961 domain-containing protein [Phycisphaeraceae bacterium]